jgi:hypothetical protein
MTLPLTSYLLLLFLALPAWATTYYVDAASAAGGDGTTADLTGAHCAWDALTDVTAAAIRPGDTVRIQAGRWNVTFTIPDSGTSDSPIIFTSYAGAARPSINKVVITTKDRVILDNLDIINLDGNATDKALALSGATNSIVRDCNVGSSGYGVTLAAACNAVTFQDCNSTGAATGKQWMNSSGSSTNISVIDCNITTTTAGALYFSGTSALAITGCTISNCTSYGCQLNSCNGTLLIDDCTISNINVALRYGLYILDSAFTSATVDDTTFTDVTASGVTLANSSGITFHRITQTRSAQFDVTAGSSAITVEDSTVEYGSDGFSTNGAANHDITYRRCISRYNGNKGSSGSGDAFTAHGEDYAISIESCIAHHNTNTACAMVGTSSGFIYNLTSYANGGNWTGEGGLDSVRGGLYFSLTGVNPTTGTSWVVRNYNGSGNYPAEVHVNTDAKDLIDLDYNCFYHVGSGITEAAFASIDGGSHFMTWSTYHATYEANSKYGDPLFINAAGGDFHLSPDSPCIDAGTDLGDTYKLDYDSKDQDLFGSGWEIGAYVGFRGGGKVPLLILGVK